MKDQTEIQAEAVKALIDNHGGTVHGTTGIGKSKILIEYLMKVTKPGNTVLITVPLGKLVDNWKEEFEKWTLCSFRRDFGETLILTVVIPNGSFECFIETIQTAYKWKNCHFNFLVIDECHTTVTPEYSAIFDNVTRDITIGLTATLDVLGKAEKQALYDAHMPVVFEYTDGEKDEVVNKTKFYVIEHELNDIFRIQVGKKPKTWWSGEKTQYEYLQKQLKAGQLAMAQAGSDSFFEDAAQWFWKKQGNKEQIAAGMKYLNSITARRKFLLTLQSSAEIAKRLAKQIILENDHNKVLVFSELVDQLKKICLYNVYGNQSEDLNTQLIQNFNEGTIRALGSVNTLSMGMNLVGANCAIFESYSGSTTKAQQKVGRMHRLQVDQTAHIYFISVKGTQSETWLDSMLREYDLADVETINSLTILK